jgi:glycogen debranching enzyme
LDIIEVGSEFYILAKSGLADDRTLVLKHGETFAVFDRYGDIQPVGMGEQGLYHEGTRFLSKITLTCADSRPMLLSSTVREDNVLLAVDLSNPDLYNDRQIKLPRGTLHIYRSKFLWDGVCFERLRISNFGLEPTEATFTLAFDSDFADIFEVRGQKREKRGRRFSENVGQSEVVLAYEGLDNLIRRTRIGCQPAADSASDRQMTLVVRLGPRQQTDYVLTYACETMEPRPQRDYDLGLERAVSELRQKQATACTIYTRNEQLNHWINRSAADLRMMVTNTPHGLYPYAGVPWFSTVFGRDGIITALEYLWVDPEIARGVLSYLAATQASETDAASDAEPGKIVHELRGGEMAALGEIPFRRYYGSTDSTPLFVMLAAAFYERTGDLDFVRSVWPNIERALYWVDCFGDQDRDGFVEYFRRSPNGLVQQGWKDSQDSVFHQNGQLAEGPIALCEVQGYVYAARRGAAAMAVALGHEARAAELTAQAEALRRQFEEAYWCEDLGTYALALDGAKRPCRVRTSNPGHCLYSGIVSAERAERVAETLLSGESYSGWGIRTVASNELRYNPMSYHNGSVWPHDNAIIAMGLARYNLKPQAAQVLGGMLDLSIFSHLNRLPELFCGFSRRAGKGPTLYPVACSPQAWAAGAVFLVLQAVLGLQVRGGEAQIAFTHPCLPEFLPTVDIRNLRAGEASVDLVLERYQSSVGVDVKRREGEVRIVMVA